MIIIFPSLLEKVFFPSHSTNSALEKKIQKNGETASEQWFVNALLWYLRSSRLHVVPAFAEVLF